MGNDYSELRYGEMLLYIAAGLQEMQDKKALHGGKLRAGMNVLAAFAAQNGGDDILEKLNETAFISDILTKPVSEWFVGWNKEFVDRIKSFPLYETGELIKLTENGYVILDDCFDILEGAENDLMCGEEQRYLYDLMRTLPQEKYSEIRTFLVKNPIIAEKDIREMKLKDPDERAAKIFETAYDHVPADMYICPKCGWTLSFSGLQAYCCNSSCVVGISKVDHNLKPVPFGSMRLKRGAMRYIAIPGKLELEIKEYAEKQGFKCEMYPEMDKYDIKIIGKSVSIAIDAKTHKNPYILRGQIRNDNALLNAGCDKAFYVVPDERLIDHRGYCDICNDVLRNNNVRCITFKELKVELKGVADV